MKAHATDTYDASRVANAALQGFFSISERWQLSVEEQKTLLGSPSRSTFYRWKKEQSAASLNHDTLERISYLFGIHKALNILLPSARAADDWVRKPNAAPLFNGQSALDRMLAGNVTDLAEVRRYLDAQRG